MRENDYQAYIIRTLKAMLPGCIVLKNDPNYIQGMLDLVVLYGERWVALEVKTSVNAKERPNQRHYVNQMSRMSYAAFIYPENEAEVLREVQYALAG